MVKIPEHMAFPELAERVCARYDQEQDSMLLGMLGQEYVIRHDGIFLRGQKAPETHILVLTDYLSSPAQALVMTPWRSIAEFGPSATDFRERVEVPLTHYAAEIVARASTILAMADATVASSLIGSDLALTVRVLPKIYLHVELSQETQDFPAEIWLLFSRNAGTFVAPEHLLVLGELFKDRMLSLLRIY